MTAEQRAKAKASEEEFQKRVSERGSRSGPVTLNIDFAGRRIYGGGKEEGAQGGEVAGKAAEAGNSEGGAAGGTDSGAKGLFGVLGGGRAARGPTKDLMAGPTLEQDMSLGAQYSRGGGGISCASDNLTGRAKEVYDLLMRAHSGRGGGGGGESGGSRVKHVEDGWVGEGGGGGMDGREVTEEDVGCCGEYFNDDDDDDNSRYDAIMGGLGSLVVDHEGDQGICMSMHQPWASLVVHGIKQVEGRDWETKHRGRLWIASTKRLQIAPIFLSFSFLCSILFLHILAFPIWDSAEEEKLTKDSGCTLISSFHFCILIFFEGIRDILAPNAMPFMYSLF